MSDEFVRARELFIEGNGCFAAGRFGDAEERFLACLALLPGRVSALTNLGATRNKLGKHKLAAEVLEQAVAAEPGNQEAWSHLGVAMAALDRHEDAVACYDKALAPDAGLAAAWLRRGEALQCLDRHDAALDSYDRALAIDPAMAQAWSSRGSLLKDLGRREEAVAAFESALAHGGDAELNGYFLASLTGRAAPAAAPRRYVQGLFDGYAGQFDQHLVGVLHYQAHEVLARQLRAVAGRSFDYALDLGCGTGLCAPLLADMARRMDGVDLSAAMLGKARARGLYTELTQADIVQYLQETGQRYDLVVSADVFIYVGDLLPVFSGVQRVLVKSGVFSFSVELAGDERDYELRPSQRYAHSERYLRQLAQRHGFEVLQLMRHAVREDQRQPVEGLFACLRRD